VNAYSRIKGSRLPSHLVPGKLSLFFTTKTIFFDVKYVFCDVATFQLKNDENTSSAKGGKKTNSDASVERLILQKICITQRKKLERERERDLS
jgi:hypothetical protein